MKHFCIFIFVLIVVNAYSQQYEPSCSGERIRHTFYTLCYSEKYEQSQWVYYQLTREMASGTAGRTEDFRVDPEISTGSATPSDYQGSGYDRGHLCPAADMKQSGVAMSETFFMSNMSPQEPGFNRGIWSNLEAQVRSWAKQQGKIWVVTGPVFRDDKGTIGIDKVTVPGYYYKVLYCETNHFMIGFMLPNRSGDRQLNEYALSVDSLETLTGIDFFSQLPDTLESRLEGSVSLTGWDFLPAATRGNAKFGHKKSLPSGRPF